MINRLHDLIDAREASMTAAKERAKEIIRTRFWDAMEQTKDTEAALALLAVWVADELTDMTTDTVKQSFDLARKLLA